MVTFDTVLADAERLPIVDRERLIEALLERLPERDSPPLSAEWLAEIQRRSAALDRGETTTVPMDVVMAELQARSARRHGDAQS